MSRILRAWAGLAMIGLPLLALLLIPQLMRSRGSTEQMMMIGVGLQMVLLAGLIIAAPVGAALTAAAPQEWLPGTALSAARETWSRNRRTGWTALGVFAAVYTAGQVVAYGFAAVVPYAGSNGPLPGWTIHYGPYAVQALIIYAWTTLAAALYALRLRRAPVNAPVPSLRA